MLVVICIREQKVERPYLYLEKDYEEAIEHGVKLFLDLQEYLGTDKSYNLDWETIKDLLENIGEVHTEDYNSQVVVTKTIMK